MYWLINRQSHRIRYYGEKARFGRANGHRIRYIDKNQRKRADFG
jgi:hypothetical protein